jgi:hypothetical protein
VTYYTQNFPNTDTKVLLNLIGDLILINFRDLEGLTFRFFLQQFLPWLIDGDFSIECLTYIDYDRTSQYIKRSSRHFFNTSCLQMKFTSPLGLTNTSSLDFSLISGYHGLLFSLKLIGPHVNN